LERISTAISGMQTEISSVKMAEERERKVEGAKIL
jgi:hypothetical protein